jgi:hypothetical protein
MVSKQRLWGRDFHRLVCVLRKTSTLNDTSDPHGVGVWQPRPLQQTDKNLDKVLPDKDFQASA